VAYCGCGEGRGKEKEEEKRRRRKTERMNRRSKGVGECVEKEKKE